MTFLGKLAFCLAATALTAPAFAAGPSPFQYHDDHHDDHRDHHDDHHDDYHHDDYHHDYDHRADWHPGPGGHWERGHRYDGRVVIINDYRARRLREPPRGYHWVRADNNDLLLVAIATGVIADIVSQ